MIRHLFVPGLLGPVPGLERGRVQAWPHLERLLARADRVVEPVGYAAGLFALFGIEAPAGADLPTAAVCFQADTGESPAACVLHADPLQLHPDRDSLLAFDLDDDPLGSAETDELVETFNAHFEDAGIRLDCSPAGRLYLHCDHVPSLRTHPVSDVIGRNLDQFLPEGDEQRRWRGLLNETQMVCHTLRLNRARDAAGRPLLGGLWFSGAGVMPPPGQEAVARMQGNCPLARGLLARHSVAAGDELIVEHAAGRAVMRADPGGWLRAVAAIDERLPGLLRGGTALYLHPGNGTVFRWHAQAARRWWRRRRPLFDHLDEAPGAAGRPR